MSFKVGDVVRLKSGGPEMTVQVVMITNNCKVIWFYEGALQYGEFDNNVLELMQTEAEFKGILSGFATSGYCNSNITGMGGTAYPEISINPSTGALTYKSTDPDDECQCGYCCEEYSTIKVGDTVVLSFEDSPEMIVEQIGLKYFDPETDTSFIDETKAILVYMNGLKIEKIELNIDLLLKLN